MEKIVKLKLKDIDSFKGHPFIVNNDSSLLELAESIKNNGLINPIVVKKM